MTYSISKATESYKHSFQNLIPDAIISTVNYMPKILHCYLIIVMFMHHYNNAYQCSLYLLYSQYTQSSLLHFKLYRLSHLYPQISFFLPERYHSIYIIYMSLKYKIYICHIKLFILSSA